MYSTPIRLRADLLVTAEDGTTQLLIEAKKVVGAAAASAARLMQGRVAAANAGCFFLFITTQKFWLWSPAATESVYEGATDALLGRYVDLEKIPLITLEERAFVLLIYSWLSSIIFKPAATLLQLPGQDWLVTTGLQPLIHRAYIHLEAEVS